MIGVQLHQANLAKEANTCDDHHLELCRIKLSCFPYTCSRCSNFTNYLVHAHTVVPRLSFPPPHQLTWTAWEKRLAIDVLYYQISTLPLEKISSSQECYPVVHRMTDHKQQHWLKVLWWPHNESHIQRLLSALLSCSLVLVHVNPIRVPSNEQANSIAKTLKQNNLQSPKSLNYRTTHDPHHIGTLQKVLNVTIMPTHATNHTTSISSEKKLVGCWGAPELELLASNFPTYHVQ